MPLFRLGQVALPIADADRSGRFCGEVLGLPKLFRFGTLVFFDCAGVRLMLAGSPKTVHPAAGVRHGFRIEGIDSSVRELAAKGVPFDDSLALTEKRR